MPVTKPNTNCLEGLRCFACGAHEPFHIEVTTILTVHDEGGDDVENIEWTSSSPCECQGCSARGTIADFEITRHLVIFDETSTWSCVVEAPRGADIAAFLQEHVSEHGASGITGYTFVNGGIDHITAEDRPDLDASIRWNGGVSCR